MAINLNGTGSITGLSSISAPAISGVPAGTASAPAFSFTGDSNTGVYSPGADQIALSTGGTGRLFIDSSGRVGLGTSSPGALFDVSGGGGNGRFQVSPTPGVVYYNTLIGSGGYGSAINDATQHIWYVGGAEAARITNSGRLGVGTTNPQSLLNISTASTSGDQNVLISGTAASGISGSHALYLGAYGSTQYGCKIKSIYNYSANLSTELSFEISKGGTLTEAVRIDSSGRLLVGTGTARSNYRGSIAPTIQLEETTDNGIASFVNTNSVNGPFLWLGKSRGTTIGSNTIVQNDDSLGAVRFNGADGTNVILGAQIAANVDGTPGANDMPTRLVFSTTADGASSPTERMRITQAGFTKITSTGSVYQAAGTYHEMLSGSSSSPVLFCQHSSATGAGVEVYYTNTINGTANRFFWGYDNSATRFEVRSNGGIGNYQANNVNLSDLNAKKDIAPAADTWNCIKEWEIVNYRYKDQPDDADLNLGVIAQQVAQSCPEVITVFEEAKDDQPEKLGVKEQQMYWMAIKALQEAQARIETLEAKVSALETA